MNNFQAVILAGGKGQRLERLTKSIPKPMVKVNGVPFLEILLNMLKRRGLSNFLLLVGYHSKVLIDYFGDGSKFGLVIRYSIEKEFLGTGGGLKKAANLLDNEFLLINGDTYLDFDYSKFIAFSKNCKSICTIVSYNGEKFDDVEYNLRLDYNNLVLDYSKVGQKNNLNAVDAGVYFMRKNILEKIGNKVSSLEIEIFPSLIYKKQIMGFPTKERFYDIGTPTRLDDFKKFFRKNIK